MSDFLSRLIERNQGVIPTLQPLIRPSLALGAVGSREPAVSSQEPEDSRGDPLGSPFSRESTVRSQESGANLVGARLDAPKRNLSHAQPAMVSADTESEPAALQPANRPRLTKETKVSDRPAVHSQAERILPPKSAVLSVEEQSPGQRKAAGKPEGAHTVIETVREMKSDQSVPVQDFIPATRQRSPSVKETSSQIDQNVDGGLRSRAVVTSQDVGKPGTEPSSVVRPIDKIDSFTLMPVSMKRVPEINPVPEGSVDRRPREAFMRPIREREVFFQEPEAPPPTIQVSIGRVEVRAIPAQNPPAPAPSPRRWEPGLSLDTYLKERTEGKR
ncbi:MAG: hypothetical protein PHV74_10515 [Dehalococcoidia bacterium]|nr:hypothetical protein [Dehalococcoidia bacterium]